MFVDYEYYKNIYRGTEITSSSFPSYEVRARSVVKNYCMKPNERFEKVLQGEYADNLRLAMCELMDNTKTYETLLETAKNSSVAYVKGIKSESVKDHSVSFNDKDVSVELEKDKFNKEISIMRKYLLITGLLNRSL